MTTLPPLRRMVLRNLRAFIVLCFFQGVFGTIALILIWQYPELGRITVLCMTAYFLLTLAAMVVLADRAAERISRPVKNLAEILQKRPRLGKPLNLPPPSSLEFMILSTELNHVWERLSAITTINFEDLILEKIRVEAVLECVEDALVVVDLDGRVTHCNQELLNLIQLPSAKVVDVDWDDLPTLNENYLKLRDFLHKSFEADSQIDLLVGGEKRNFSARWRIIRGIGGKSVATLFLLHDITCQQNGELAKAG